jgi:arsenite-transporting ATPase
VRLVLYAGKGGVGKTTTAAATAVHAARSGRRTLVASADIAHSLGDVFERRLGPEPTSVAPDLDAIEIDARVETTRHWGRIRDFLVELLQHQGIDAVMAEELALLPGAEEVTTLLAVEGYARSGAYDFAVVDCAPTDSALRLLTLPDIAHRALRVLLPLARAVSGVAVPLARRLVSLPMPDSGVFRDADRLVFRELRALRSWITAPETSVRIVATPERMVIDESRRAYAELSLFEVPCDAAVMNRVLPEAAAGEEFFREWGRVQGERCHEVADLFAPLPLLVAPLRREEVTGLERLAEHGRQIFADAEPDAVLSRAPRIRFEREDSEYRALVPLPGADADHVDVVKVDDEVTITTGLRRRSFKVPRRIAPLQLASAKLEGSCLVVSFRRDAAGAEAD